jgi:4-hydroxy-tetrahydrodipicolinate synthase
MFPVDTKTPLIAREIMSQSAQKPAPTSLSLAKTDGPKTSIESSRPPAGIYVALATPFDQSGAIDFLAFDRYVEALVDSGIAGVVVAGTTGEGMTLSVDEFQALVARAVHVCAGRVHVMAGVAACAARNALTLCAAAQTGGADSVLVLTPYYVKASQEAMATYFRAVHDGSALPMVLYNNPGRTGVSLAVETLESLGQCPRIVGLKDSSQDLSRTIALQKLKSNRGWRLFSGDDPSLLGFLALGGDGAISVVAGVCPRAVLAVSRAVQAGNLASACATAQVLAPLIEALFSFTSPGPLKQWLNGLGYMDRRLRVASDPAARSLFLTDLSRDFLSGPDLGAPHQELLSFLLPPCKG